jgi:hypothetical protein
MAAIPVLRTVVFQLLRDLPIEAGDSLRKAPTGRSPVTRFSNSETGTAWVRKPAASIRERVLVPAGVSPLVSTEDAAALIIHEELHSLGLAENPPSSAAITDRVISRCGRSAEEGAWR